MRLLQPAYLSITPRDTYYVGRGISSRIEYGITSGCKPWHNCHVEKPADVYNTTDQELICHWPAGQLQDEHQKGQYT